MSSRFLGFCHQVGWLTCLAGLCHDLGHGPLSHMFEGVARKLTNNPKWNHEEMSCKLFSCICEDIRNEEPEELHISPSVEERVLRAIQGIRGEGPKGFLVDIVSNFRNGIDVDKLDYLARDARYTNFTAGQKVHQFHRSLIEGEVEHDRIKCMRVRSIPSFLPWWTQGAPVLSDKGLITCHSVEDRRWPFCTIASKKRAWLHNLEAERSHPSPPAVQVVDGQLSWHIDSRHDIAGVYLERAAMHDNAYLHRQVLHLPLASAESCPFAMLHKIVAK